MKRKRRKSKNHCGRPHRKYVKRKNARRKFSKRRNPRKILRPRRQLSVPERHQLKIAMDTLRMPDAMANVMGGPTKAEAREIIFRFTGRRVKENPARRRK